MSKSTVFDHLPNLIKDGVQAFSSNEEKLVYATSAITVLSSCFPTLKGVYDGREVFPNLYGFIVAPAGSGKSAMKYAKELAAPIHELQLQKTKNEVAKRKKSAKSAKNASALTPPVNSLLFLPGNSSSTAIAKTMMQNKLGNILVETEADTLSQTLGKDFGGFSDLLRKAYHHEPIDMLRATHNVYVYIPKPKLSVLLTCTPHQLPNLIPNCSDGLFSRFMYLKFDQNVTWRNVFSATKPISDTTEPLSRTLKEYYEYGKSKDFDFSLTETQQASLNDQGENWLKEAMELGADAAALAYRMGLILFRISMVLSIIRHLENGEATTLIQCYDNDFDSALELAKVYFSSSLELYSKHNQPVFVKKSVELNLFYEHLPESYKVPQDIFTVAQKIGVSERTARNYQSRLIKAGRVKTSGTKKTWEKVLD